MATFVLIPGADGRAWYWSRTAPELVARGHQAVAVDLPVADASAGLDDYAAVVTDAMPADVTDAILVAQSLAGFVAPLVAARTRAGLIVLLNAMVPTPGESAGEWWDDTGQAAARADHYARHKIPLPADFDPFEAFFHDAPDEVVAEARAIGEPPSRFDTLFRQPWPLDAWPQVPTRFLQAREDRFFPLEFQRSVVRQRLGIEIDEMPGGHLVALSRPGELAERLDAYARSA